MKYKEKWFLLFWCSSWKVATLPVWLCATCHSIVTLIVFLSLSRKMPEWYCSWATVASLEILSKLVIRYHIMQPLPASLNNSQKQNCDAWPLKINEELGGVWMKGVVHCIKVIYLAFEVGCWENYGNVFVLIILCVEIWTGKFVITLVILGMFSGGV